MVNNNGKNYKNYTNKEMQAITIAKEIKDGQIVIVGQDYL